MLVFLKLRFYLFPSTGVMVAWAGIEHFRMGRFDPPPPANEPEDALVCFPTFISLTTMQICIHT